MGTITKASYEALAAECAEWHNRCRELEAAREADSDLTTRTLAAGYDIQAKQRDRIRELEAELAAEKENSARGWELFWRFRKKYAELRFPGMTAEVHAALVPKEPT